MSTNITPSLHSEDVVVEAPMSLTGSARRIWRLTRRLPDGGPIRWLGATGLVLLIAVAWVFVLGWYLLFGLLLVPYRLMRRHQRNKHRQDLQHRETLALMTEIANREKPS